VTPYFDCGFEDAAIGTHWDYVNSAVLDTTITGRTGTNAARMDITSGARCDIGHTMSAHAAYAATLRFRVSALPTSQISIFRHGGAVNYDLWIALETDGKLTFYAGSGSGQASTATISTNTWYTLSWWIDGTAHTAGWSIDGTAQTAPTVRVDNETYNIFYCGNTQSASAGTFSMYVDDILFTLTTGDYPFAAGYVNSSDDWVTYAPSWTTPADTVSMSTTPELKFNSPASAVAQHFYLQLDTDAGFATGNLRTLDSSTSQTGWDYWTGAAWAALPSTGLASTYAGNEIRYTVTSALSSATWYRRVRAGTLV
jgi:hypothetical protein